MADVPGELAELYRAWSDEEILRRYRDGGLVDAAREAMERELRARGFDPSSVAPREAAEPLVEFHALDRATHGDLLDQLAARLEGNTVPQGRSFFIDAATIEMLERQGLDPAQLDVLRAELGDLEGVEVVDPSVPESAVEEAVAREFVHNPLRFRIHGRAMGPLHPYYVEDERGNRLYEIAQTPAFERYQIEDTEGRTLVQVKRRVLSLGRYDVVRDGREVAVIHGLRREIALGRGTPLLCDFAPTSSRNWLRRDGRLVALMHGDLAYYGPVVLDIDRGEDPIDMLGVLLALALICRDDTRSTQKLVDGSLK